MTPEPIQSADTEASSAVVDHCIECGVTIINQYSCWWHRVDGWNPARLLPVSFNHLPRSRTLHHIDGPGA
jgi:hypothetical protein